MTKATDIDLADAMDAIEDLGKRFDNLSLEAQIDVAARLKGVAKTCKAIDEATKEAVKKQRKGKMGYVFGSLFKAYLNLIPVTRLDQQKLELDYPDVYAECLKKSVDRRITFEVR